ncbi:uncharacterized protein LOC130449943 [Diorhabda sublineata]|uniref:uncharacterized protein LOC130449943 n=1 Tax=Diorhabda sublineata TaxID=1163346 RepID=UPI0024E12FD8|nr:uncharacterized protein LOC130449943 [Diorhabda sublineata]
MSVLNICGVLERVGDKEGAVKFFQHRGIIKKVRRLCRKKHLMTVTFSGNYDRCICSKRSCREEKGLRIGTWLDGTILSLKTIALFIYAWSQEYSLCKFLERELAMSREAMSDWRNYLREVCANSLLRDKRKIGGTGMTVEIDKYEFMWSSRYKNVDSKILLISIQNYEKYYTLLFTYMFHK